MNVLGLTIGTLVARPVQSPSARLRATIPAIDVSAILKLFDWFVPLTSEVPSTASAKATLDGS